MKAIEVAHGSAGSTRSTWSAGASAARCCPRRSRCCARAATTRGEPDACSPPCSTSGARRPGRLHRRSRRRAARDDDRRGRHLSGQRARLRVPDAARQRPDLAVRRQQLPQGQDAGGLRPAVLERRRDQPAGPMYAWYLRNMYLENNLCVPNRLSMCDEPVDLGQIDMPTYVLATQEDHIVPWRSAYRTTGSSAARPSSCWAPAATSPASSIRRRRTSAATGPTARRARSRAVAGHGRVEAGQLVDALDGVAQASSGQACSGAQEARQCHAQADRARARPLREGARRLKRRLSIDSPERRAQFWLRPFFAPASWDRRRP